MGLYGSNDVVYASVVQANGDLIIGGKFTTAGGLPANHVARWNGSSLVPLGTGVDQPGGTSQAVYALTMAYNGDLIVGGQFTTAGGQPANCIARWNGSSWAPLGTGMNGPVYALAASPNGDIFAGGHFFTAGGVPANHIARWNSASWSQVGLGSGINGIIYSFAVMPNGNLIAGGQFTTAGGAVVNNIARWNGSSWAPLGTGMNGPVYALAALPNGDIIAGGGFSTAGGVSASNIARWNGGNWMPLGAGVNGAVYALTVLHDGSVVAGGATGAIVLWNGATWTQLGTLQEAVVALASFPNGTLFAAANEHVYRWNGSSWSNIPRPAGMMIRNLAVHPSGDLLACGSNRWEQTGVVRRWNGSSWTEAGDIFISSRMRDVNVVTVLPNSDIIAGGYFWGSAGYCIARLRGSSWEALGAGVHRGAVRALAVLPNNEIVAGGNKLTFEGTSTRYWARWSDTGVPWIARHPASLSVGNGQTATLSSTCASGYDVSGPVTVQWYRNGVAISDGPGGASLGGGIVSGASRVLPSPTNDPTATLSISSFRPSDSGQYTVVFSNACGSTTSSGAIVRIPPCNAADIASTDGSPVPDSFLDNGDFMLFFAVFFTSECSGPPAVPCSLADIAANDATPGPDGWVNNGDFFRFIASFFAGCP